MKLVIELPGGAPQAIGTPIFGRIFVPLYELLTKEKRQSRRYAENPRDTAVFQAGDPQGHFFQARGPQDHFFEKNHIFSQMILG